MNLAYTIDKKEAEREFAGDIISWGLRNLVQFPVMGPAY